MATVTESKKKIVKFQVVEIVDPKTKEKTPAPKELKVDGKVVVENLKVGDVFEVDDATARVIGSRKFLKKIVVAAPKKEDKDDDKGDDKDDKKGGKK